MGAPTPQNPIDAAITESTPLHRARIAAIVGRNQDITRDAENPLMTGIRSFAGGIEETGKRALRGAGQIVGNLGDTVGSQTLQKVGNTFDQRAAELGRQQAGVLPSPESIGRSDPLFTTAMGTAGEAAPQFLLGEGAGKIAAPLTRSVGRIVPQLAPQLSPAVAEGTTALGEGAKAFGRAIVPQIATQTAAFAPLAKDEPVSPMGLGMSALGALGEANGAARGVVGTQAAQGRADATATRAAVMAKAGAEENITQQAGGTPPVASTARVPADQVPQRMVQAGLADQSVRMPQQFTQTEPTPAFPEGYSTKSDATTRRIVPPSELPQNPIDAAIEAPRAAPTSEPVPTIGEPVSVGRDLNAPGRIPTDQPRVPSPRGVEPSGNIQTDEGAVSVGRRNLPIERQAAVEPDRATAQDMADYADRPQRSISGDEPAIRTQKGKLVANLSTLGDQSLMKEFAALHSQHVEDTAFVDSTHENWPGKEHGMDPDEGWSQDNSDVQALKRQIADVERIQPRRQAELDRIELELRRRKIDPTEALIPREVAPKPAPDAELPRGEGKDTPAQALVNRGKLGLTTPEQHAELTQQLETAKSDGTDRGHVTLEEQDRAARQSMADHLAFGLESADPAKVARMTGAEIGQLYERVSTNVAQTAELSKTLETDKTLSPEAQQQLHETLDHLRGQNAQLLDQIVTSTAQKGRDLNYLRQVASQSTDPAVWLTQAKRALGDNVMTDEVQSAIVKLANAAREACGG